MENGDCKLDIEYSAIEPTDDVKIEEVSLKEEIISRQIKAENCYDNFTRSINATQPGNMGNFNMDLVDVKTKNRDFFVIKGEIEETELIIKEEMDTDDDFSYMGASNRRSYKGVPEESITSSKDKVSSSGRVHYETFCYFCKKLVPRFGRHIMRHHLSEYEVQEIYSFPALSKERKKLITALRNKGNYVRNAIKCDRPMRKSNSGDETLYLPCPKCLGFYARKQLYRHRKKCCQDTSVLSPQVESQNFLVKNLNIDKQLQDEIFPIMRPDAISLLAKRDRLICAYGAHYIKTHRHKSFSRVASRKMRELSRILREMQKLEPSIRNFTDALKSKYYSLIVAATKHIAGYDDKTKVFTSPTVARNISNSLKECCQIAIKEVPETYVDKAQAEDDLRKLSCLIEKNWRVDVSSQVGEYLFMRKWNKVTIVPLVIDLKLLNDCLHQKAKDNAAKLQTTIKQNVDVYNELLESVYCRMILFNRHRSMWMPSFLWSTYDKAEIGGQVDSSLLKTEEVLQKTCKVIHYSNKEQSIPFFFNPNLQNDIDILKSVRNIYLQENNEFLFAQAGCTSILQGHKVIEKYAKLCGAKNPNDLSLSRLRKHIAILTQIFSMSSVEIEELANNIGFSGPVPNLQDNPNQIAIMTNLLLMQGKSKSLVEIEEETVGGTEGSVEDNSELRSVPDENTQHDSLQIQHSPCQEKTVAPVLKNGLTSQQESVSTPKSAVDENGSESSGLKSHTDFCYFCKKIVKRFSRHIMRHHLSEYEVQEVYSFPALSKERKELLTALRKKGNFLCNKIKCDKPVRKSKSGSDTLYLPCPKCLGFYARKQICRHRKKCGGKTSALSPQVEAQNFLVKDLNIDKQLLEEVFSIMRPDEISLLAKRDWLICAFGLQYIRTHRHKKFSHAASCKMRQLSKILIEMQKLNPTIRNFTDALTPQNYDLIVAATKHILGYDDKEKSSLPTMIRNVSISLTHCCRIALEEASKLDTSVDTQVEDNLKKLIHLIEDNWKVDFFNRTPDKLFVKKLVRAKNTEQNSLDMQDLSSEEMTKVAPVGKRRVLVPWTAQQKSAVLKFFREHIKSKKPPKRHECEMLKEEYPELLENKGWLKIKVFVQNVYTKKYGT